MLTQLSTRVFCAGEIRQQRYSQSIYLPTGSGEAPRSVQMIGSATTQNEAVVRAQKQSYSALQICNFETSVRER